MVKLSVDFSQDLGPIKPLNGINNGPLCFGETIDLSDRFREAKFPYSRLHDPNWPHPYEVDIHTVFPDFSRDPARPESYQFRRTDEYIASIKNTGADIVYRLGESIEHSKTKYHVHPPADFKKWTQICIGIIRHMNEGWGDGHHFGIRYWEIWNEPDNPSGECMWSGTDQQYFDLYATAATAIKDHDSTLKVGGYAATMVNDAFLLAFLEQCRNRNLPLDFFSWHTYTQDVSFLVGNARKVKGLLEQYGFGQAEVHLNEWNYAPIDTGVDASDAAKTLRHVFQAMHGAKGMSYDASAMLALLDEPVDLANFYDVAASSIWGMFDPYGVPYMSFWAFKAFGLLREGNRVRTKVEGDRLYAAASILEKQKLGRIMISNPSEKSEHISLDCAGQILRGYIADPEGEWRPLDVDPAKLQLPGYSVCLLEISQI
ncbi:MAG: hypothetical protein IJY82_03105 [Oscillospiraceae bacterium]|nr:hypothetical protein [Oscillospiraceae bacterium]